MKDEDGTMVRFVSNHLLIVTERLESNGNLGIHQLNHRNSEKKRTRSDAGEERIQDLLWLRFSRLLEDRQSCQSQRPSKSQTLHVGRERPSSDHPFRLQVGPKCFSVCFQGGLQNGSWSGSLLSIRSRHIASRQ
jgi:hypothetical protein